MARRRQQRGSRAKHNNVWTAVILTDVAVTSAATTLAAIVTPDEWQAASTGFKHGTLLRIRGWISASKTTVPSGTSTLFMAIIVEDEVVVPTDPGIVAAYNEQDALWSAGIQMPATLAASVEQGASFMWNVDVKAMRRIDSALDVRLVLRSSGPTFTVSGVLRGLVRVDS